MAVPSDSAPSAGPGRPKVLYVMGAGRSGSTILGVALGNCDDVFFAGELDKWLQRSGKPKLAGEEQERFWAQVQERVEGAQELFGYEAHRYLERSSGLFRLRRPRAARRLRARYLRVSEDLYRAVAETAGVAHVVDSAHYPLRAHELQAMSGVELYLLLLVRDPQSVVASFAREDVAERRFDAPTTNLYLWLTYLLATLTFLRHPRERRLLVRHEDFLEDPQAVLSAILRMAGAPESEPDLSALRTGLPLVGNRLVDSEIVSFAPRAAKPARRSLLTTVMQAPFGLLFSRLRPVAHG
jgi:Sulfotransferase family